MFSMKINNFILLYVTLSCNCLNYNVFITIKWQFYSIHTERGSLDAAYSGTEQFSFLRLIQSIDRIVGS